MITIKSITDDFEMTPGFNRLKAHSGKKQWLHHMSDGEFTCSMFTQHAHAIQACVLFMCKRNIINAQLPYRKEN